MDLPVAVKALSKLLALALTEYEAVTVEGFDTKELATLPALTDLLGELKAGERSLDMEALHLGVITRCFGQALGRHWAFNKSMVPKGFRLFMSKEERKRADEINVRMNLATEDLEGLGRPGDLPAGVGAWRHAGALSSGPLATPYYRALWRAFTDPKLEDGEAGTPPLIDLGETGRLEFERHFLLAYHQVLSTSAGQPLQSYLERLAGDYRRDLLRELFIKDMAAWNERHTFGNIERHDRRTEDPIPFMPLGQMYVQPDARLGGEGKKQEHEEETSAPVLELVERLLGEQKKNVLVIKADFGMGKSLTSRTLAQRWARRFLNGQAPSPELVLPVYIRCADDLPDEGFDLEQTVRRAWMRQAEDLGLPLKLDDKALSPPGQEQRAIFLFDGLDEVILGERRLESFFKHLREQASNRHHFIVFSRPGALPGDQELKNIPVLELRPWSDDQSAQWLGKWRELRGEGPDLQELKKRKLNEFSGTPILLFMVAQTWSQQSTEEDTRLAALYERFFWQIAKGKHEADCEEHPNIAKASSELREHLARKKFLSEEADAPDAMLWLMGRVAWEATKLEQHQMLEPLRKAKVLMKRDIENLIVDELEVERDASDTINTIQVGLLLTMQAHLRSNAASQILFGHKSFREYLVARYWADRMKALARARERDWDDLEKPLLGGRLLSREDRTFDFLMEMLNGAPLPEHPHSPFGLDQRECDALLDWAQSRFDSEEQQDPSSNRHPALRDDRRPWFREAALAIGSRLRGSPGLSIQDKLSVRSMLAWFWLMRIGPIIVAPKAQWKEALLSENTLRGADFHGANLEGVHFTNSSFSILGNDGLRSNFAGATLDRAIMVRVRLEGADFEKASLKSVNLSEAILTNALLAKANLEGANLEYANLMAAHLLGANLTRAELAFADLRHANLEEAVLTDTVLFRADLSDAFLRGASLEGADLCEANLCDASLEGANLRRALYDMRTKWPEGFDPVAAGAILQK
ncbi:NACHT domain-containing protein [Archangium gephyra]|nr:NACHT domain-containing protein [Archangium gephyra]